MIAPRPDDRLFYRMWPWGVGVIDVVLFLGGFAAANADDGTKTDNVYDGAMVWLIAALITFGWKTVVDVRATSRRFRNYDEAVTAQTWFRRFDELELHDHAVEMWDALSWTSTHDHQLFNSADWTCRELWEAAREGDPSRIRTLESLELMRAQIESLKQQSDPVD